MIVSSFKSESIFKKGIGDLENFCVIFNRYNEAMFLYLKFILVFILFMIGLLTIFKYRGFWRAFKFKEYGEEDTKDMGEKIKEPNVILGIAYIAMGFGILFNYLTLFLIWLLDPLPDGFIFAFLNFSGDIDPESIDRLSDLKRAKYPHEKTIYYCVAYASFGAFLNLILGVRFIILTTNKSHKTSFALLMSGLSMGVFTGFTTFMPLFL